MTSQDESTPDDTRPSDVPEGEVPNAESGAGMGAGEPSSFEPEEDPESVPDPQ